MQVSLDGMNVFSTFETEFFIERGCIDNHVFVICKVCGDYIDLGEIKFGRRSTC
jgi:hypothetical protein